MRIIEFLLDNIFIVVIIFGALASIFGKGKRKPNQMPDFGGGGLPRSLFPQTGDKQPKEQPLTEQTEGQPVYRTSSVQERHSSASPYYAPAAADAPRGASQIAAHGREVHIAGSSKPQMPNAAERKPAAQRALAASVQAEDMRKAVIWAEILSPPRSKRPFRK